MENKLIYDVGIHIGTDTERYLKQGYNVIGIDANPFVKKHIRYWNWNNKINKKFLYKL